MTSTSPVISVQFSSGSVVEAGRGFNATYKQIPGQKFRLETNLLFLFII